MSIVYLAEYLLKKTLNNIKNRVKIHHKRKKIQKRKILESLKISTSEFINDFGDLKKEPSISKVLCLGRDFIGHSSWVSTNLYSYSQALADFSDDENNKLRSPKHKFIIDHIINNKTISKNYTDQEVFESVYLENRLTHLEHSNFKSKLYVPKIDETIVLVSGVFNELFKLAAFERGVQHIVNTSDNDYIIAKVKGATNSKHNAFLIKKQLEEYIKSNPKKKLWIIAYSKGGIDSLHYLLKNEKFANRYISGITMLAVPVLGTNHFKKAGVKLANLILKLPNYQFERFIKNYGSILSPEFQKSLNGKYRQEWFKRKHKLLPKKIFYSSVAFHSKWSESHVYMRLTKIILPNKNKNDGVVESESASFPNYFKSLNLGIYKGHHLVGARSSSFSQEALIESLIIFHSYKNCLTNPT